MKDLIRKILKEEGDFDWVTQHMQSIPNDPHYMALMECYGPEVLQGLEPKEWNHYGLTTYENEENEEYAVGTIEECDDALKDYYENLVDEVGVEGWNTNVIDPVDYMYMTNTDIRMWADDIASSNMDGMDVEDYIEQTSYSQKYEELLEKISDLESEINDIENQQIDMVDQDLEETEEYRELEDKLGGLEDLLKDYEHQKDDMEYDAKQEYQEGVYEDYKRQLERDPIEFFIDMGIYSDTNEMVENNVLSFNEEEFINDLADFGYYGEISSYDGEYCRKNIGGEDYICLKLN